MKGKRMPRLTDDQIRKIKVRKDVPIPRRAHDQRPWPFKRMKVGHSFVVPADMGRSVEHTARRFAEAQRPPWRFTVRKLSLTETGVWRVK